MFHNHCTVHLQFLFHSGMLYRIVLLDISSSSSDIAGAFSSHLTSILIISSSGPVAKVLSTLPIYSSCRVE